MTVGRDVEGVGVSRAEVKFDRYRNEVVGVLVLVSGRDFLERKFKDWGLERNRDYAVWSEGGNVFVNLYYRGFRKVGFWVGRGDEAAAQLMEKLLKGAADEKARDEAGRHFKEGVAYGRHGVPIDEVEKFGFVFIRGRGLRFVTTNEQAYKERVDLLKKYRIKRGGGLYCREKNTYEIYVIVKGVERIIEQAIIDKMAGMFLNYLYAQADISGNSEEYENLVKTVETYARYGVAVDEAYEFALNVRKARGGEITIVYAPTKLDEFNRVVGLLKEAGLREGRDFVADPPGEAGRAR